MDEAQPQQDVTAALEEAIGVHITAPASPEAPHRFNARSRRAAARALTLINQAMQAAGLGEPAFAPTAPEGKFPAGFSERTILLEMQADSGPKLAVLDNIREELREAVALPELPVRHEGWRLGRR